MRERSLLLAGLIFSEPLRAFTFEQCIAACDKEYNRRVAAINVRYQQCLQHNGDAAFCEDRRQRGLEDAERDRFNCGIGCLYVPPPPFF